MHKHVFVIVASGFLLSVNSQIDPDACGPGRIKDLHEDFGTISISYTFDSNVRCQWHVFPSIETTTKVAVVTVENVQFDSTECKQSYLQLFDNVDTDDLMDNRCEPATTARDAYTRISKSSSFTVKFLDNSGGWVGELVMHFEFIEASSDTTACGFGGPLRLTHQQGDITTPGPDLSFPINNIKCSWRIEGEGDEYVHLTLLSNSVMRAGDSATLYDGRNNRSTVLTSWNEDTELPAVKWNGGPYMYVEVDLGSAEDSVYPVVKFNFKSIKTYEWACNRTSDQGAPAYLTQVNDIILELPDYDVIGRIALNCRWSIVSHPGWIVSASVHNFTLGTQSETCGPNAAPLLTIGPEPESYLCGLVGSALHNHSFPALDVTLDLPVATRLETDYYIMKTSGQNITELACEDPYDALLTEQPGIISNTDSPHATADVHKCVWNLEAPEGWIVRLKVLEYSADCSDSACGFYIYESNDLLEFIHKSVVTEQSIYSSSNLMKIQYICSCSSPIRYFLYFSFHRATEICDPDNPILLTAEEGLITSPGYEQGTYPKDSLCQWLIEVPTDSDTPYKSIVIEFTDLDLRTNPRDDEVIVRDGPSSISPSIGFFRGRNVQLVPIVATNQTSAFVQLKSGHNYGAAKGFSLRYYVTKDPYAVMACTANSRPTLVYNASSSIMTPNYPDRFPADQLCTWRLDANETRMTELEIVDFDLGLYSKNCLDVIAGNHDGENKSIARFCGSDSAAGSIVFVAAPHAFINFSSELEAKGGFNITHRSLERHERACRLNGTPVGVHLAVSDYIQMPNLDNSRSNLVKCRWYFTASIHEVILFDSIYFDLGDDCDHSNLQLSDYTSIDKQEVIRESGCGYATHKRVWVGPIEAMAEFHTHTEPNSDPIPGFRASITFINITEGACNDNTPVFVNWAPGFIVSPNYGEGYYPPTTVLPNRCSWRVQAEPGMAIELYFEDFDVGDEAQNCVNEYLEILEDSSVHRFCGSSDPWVWTSEGHEVTITLYAPLYNNFKRGFKIVHSFVEGSDKSASNSNSAFIGIIAGVVLFVCIVVMSIVITYVFYHKKKTQQPEEHEQSEEMSNPTVAPYDIEFFMPNLDSEACAAAPPSYGDAILQGGYCQSLAGMASLTGVDSTVFAMCHDNQLPSYEESLQHNPPEYNFKQY